MTLNSTLFNVLVLGGILFAIAFVLLVYFRPKRKKHQNPFRARDPE